MATNLKIDPKLITKAKRLGKKKTKRETVVEALEEYIGKRERLGILDLMGTIDFDPTYDYKAARQRHPAKVRVRKSA